MFWITVRDAVSSLPNAHGPIKDLEAAEQFASKMINPGIYKVLDGEGKSVSEVTVSVPTVQVDRTK